MQVKLLVIPSVTDLLILPDAKFVDQRSMPKVISAICLEATCCCKQRRSSPTSSNTCPQFRCHCAARWPPGLIVSHKVIVAWKVVLLSDLTVISVSLGLTGTGPADGGRVLTSIRHCWCKKQAHLLVRDSWQIAATAAFRDCLFYNLCFLHRPL